MHDNSYFEVEDLIVCQKLCDLHVDVWEHSKSWPRTERFELTSQALRSSNSSPARLADKNDDRHLKKKIEGVNRARTEAGETIGHLYIAHRKRYLDQSAYDTFREKHKECIPMLNGLEKSLEKHLPSGEQRWVHEPEPVYSVKTLSGHPVSEHFQTRKSDGIAET